MTPSNRPNDAPSPDLRDDVLRFDPGDIELLFWQDDQMAATQAYTGPELSCHAVQSMPDGDLAAFLRDLRNAERLPLGDRFLDGIAAVLEFVESEARRRVEVPCGPQIRATRIGPPDWQRADLLAEIEVVAGPGQRRGREWWFHCPFGHSHGRSPSLHADPERRIWKCFGCGRGGGVLAWRQAIVSAA